MNYSQGIRTSRGSKQRRVFRLDHDLIFFPFILYLQTCLVAPSKPKGQAETHDVPDSCWPVPIRLPRYKGGRKGFGSGPHAANAMLKFRYVSFLSLRENQKDTPRRFPVLKI